MRVRLRYGRTGKVRWTSARDLARMWERAIRRIEVPMAYTAGFSPRPKIAFGLALSTGYDSTAEYIDLDLDDGRLEPGFDVGLLPRRFTAALPAGIDVTAAVVLGDRAPSLQHEVTSCRWEIEVVGADDRALHAIVAAALAAPELIVTRTRKGSEVTDDLRPAILSLEPLDAATATIERVATDAPSAVLAAELATQPRGVRPSELLRALQAVNGAAGVVLDEGRVCRTHQWIERDGAKWEPLPLPATDAPHAQARAS